MHDAVLVLEDGRAFYGQRFGADCDAGGEVVFNTAMTGYPQILTDPSYTRQLVALTCPMIGNYGLVTGDAESNQVHAAALLVRELSRTTSNWRSDIDLDTYLKQQGIPGLTGVDTRALVRHLRDRGAQRGILAAASAELSALQARARAVPDMAGAELASSVSTTEAYAWHAGTPAGFRHGDLGTVAAAPPPPRSAAQHRVVVLDYGVKHSILRQLVDRGCAVTVLPGDSDAGIVLAQRPQGVLLSNGPGDPQPCTAAVACIGALLGQVPIFGICLGHQLLCLALGARCHKLKHGHRGGNHAVLDLDTQRVAITAQNHGFVIDASSLPEHAQVSHINLMDQTLAGIRLRDGSAFSVQFHPEAAPGPSDAAALFDRFNAMMARGIHAQT